VVSWKSLQVGTFSELWSAHGQRSPIERTQPRATSRGRCERTGDAPSDPGAKRAIAEHFTYEWSDEEIGNVLTKADELDGRTTQRQEYSPLIHSAIETGERLGELLGSDWGDLDLDPGVWNVTKAWTKAGKLGP
jgi:integrase